MAANYLYVYLLVLMPIFEVQYTSYKLHMTVHFLFMTILFNHI